MELNAELLTYLLRTQIFQDYFISIIANALTDSIELRRAEQKRQNELPKDEQYIRSLEQRFDVALKLIMKNSDMFEEYMRLCEEKNL